MRHLYSSALILKRYIRSICSIDLSARDERTGAGPSSPAPGLAKLVTQTSVFFRNHEASVRSAVETLRTYIRQISRSVWRVDPPESARRVPAVRESA